MRSAISQVLELAKTQPQQLLRKHLLWTISEVLLRLALGTQGQVQNWGYQNLDYVFTRVRVVCSYVLGVGKKQGL